MNKEKTVFVLSLGLFCALATAHLTAPVQADTGWEGATRKEQGSYLAAYYVRGTSYTGTAFVDASVKRPAGIYFNNTASAIYIGTTTALSVEANDHTNRKIGFPVLASSTFRLDGSFTGDMYFTCEASTAFCEIRKLEGLVR